MPLFEITYFTINILFYALFGVLFGTSVHRSLDFVRDPAHRVLPAEPWLIFTQALRRSCRKWVFRYLALLLILMATDIILEESGVLIKGSGPRSCFPFSADHDNRIGELGILRFRSLRGACRTRCEPRCVERLTGGPLRSYHGRLEPNQSCQTYQASRRIDRASGSLSFSRSAPTIALRYSPNWPASLI